MNNNFDNYNNYKKNKSKKTKKVKHTPRKCIDKEIIDYLLALIDETETNEKVKFNIKIMNIFLYYTGLRINELLMLNKLNIMDYLIDVNLMFIVKKPMITGQYF